MYLPLSDLYINMPDDGLRKDRNMHHTN